MYVAVYGTLKAGYGNHRHHLKGAEFIGKGTTVRPYTMYDTGGFPVVFKDEKHNVHVEVYEATDEMVASMDRLEGHPNFFRREEISVDIGDTGVQQSAWMYFGVPEAWSNRNRMAVAPVDATGAFNWSRA